MDTTPLPLIAICAVIAILLWIALELRHQRKGGGSHYFNINRPIATIDKVEETDEGIVVKGQLSEEDRRYIEFDVNASVNAMKGTK